MYIVLLLTINQTKMKRKPNQIAFIAAILICCFTHNLIAQMATPLEVMVHRQKQQHSFASVDAIFTVDRTTSLSSVESYVAKAEFLLLDKGALKNMMDDRSEGIRLHLPDGKGTFYEIDLVQFNILANGFTVNAINEFGTVNTNYRPGNYYRGVVNGIPGSIAAFSFFENEIFGVFSIPGVGNLSILPNTMVAAQGENYILYNDADLKIVRNNPECQSDKLVVLEDENNTAALNTFSSCKDVEVMILADYATYIAKGSSTINVANYLTSIYNVMSAIYRNEGIYTSIKILNINTSTDAYYTLSQNSFVFLQKFGELTQNNLNGADLAHLVSTRYGGAMGGIAWLDMLCDPYFGATQHAGPYAFSNIYTNEVAGSFPTYSWNVECMTHEMGHNLGSNHTHSCTAWVGGAIDGCGPDAGYSEGSCTAPIPSSSVKGTIMSYCHLVSGVGIAFANGFGPQPGNLIRAKVNTGSCASNYVTDTTITVANATLNGTRECTDAAGLTFYWNDNNTIDESDDRIVLKLNKGTNNIGTLDDVGFAVNTTTLAAYGSNVGAAVNFAAGTANIGATNIAMNRYWNVTPIAQPTSTVEVLFPFTQQDVSDVAGSMPSITSHTNLLFYKIDGAVNPNPGNGLVGATAANTTVYTYNATTPSLNNWTYASIGTTRYARFLVSSFSGGGGFGASGTPLSVSLVGFKGIERNGNIALQWEVSDEKEIKEYLIEKSIDGKTYTAISYVASKNAPTALYNTLDKDAQQGYNYYRLNNISTDGKKSILAYTQVFVSKASSINIYPNPASNKLHIQRGGILAEDTQLRIADMNGKIVHQQVLTAATASVDISTFAKGIYFVQIITGTEVMNQKLVIE